MCAVEIMNIQLLGYARNEIIDIAFDAILDIAKN